MPLLTEAQQRQQMDYIAQTTWQLGIVSSYPAEEIPDGAAQDLLNVVFDDDSNLVSRNGVQLFLQPGIENRITSLFRAEYANGTVFILFTSGNQLYRCDEDGANLTNITGSLTLPTNTFWQWTMFDDYAIGVNKATAGDNPVKVDSTGAASALANAPKAKYLEVWNSRLWLVGAATNEQNTIFGSALGDPEDWTESDDAGAVTIDIDTSDGDFITGLTAFREALFIFKRRKIHVLSAISSPATIPDNLRVDIYTKNLGCISPYSIQTVLDDVLFLSDSGVASLTQSEYGELKSALLSSKVAEIARIRKVTDEIPAFVFDDANHYVLSVPKIASPRGIDEVYVLDYQRIKEGLVRWVRFDGRIAGTAYTEKLNSNYKEYLIAGHPSIGGASLWDSAKWDENLWDNATNVYKYSPLNPIKLFNDAGNAYSKVITTKAYSVNAPLIRKLWHRWGLGIRLTSSMLSLLVKYFYNNVETRGGTYNFNFAFSGTSPSLYGQAVYGTDTYASSEVSERDGTVWRSFLRNSFGRKAQTVTFQITSAQADEGFIMKFLQMQFSMLTHTRTRTK